MTTLTQYELRERLIADLPALMAQFEAKNGPVKTEPIVYGRQLSWDVTHRVSCPERREVIGAPAVAPKRKRGGIPGPKPRNVEIMRELMPLNLTISQMVERSGLSRPTVHKLSVMLRKEAEEARRESLETASSVLQFRRAWRMRSSRARGKHDRWARLSPAKPLKGKV